MSLPETSPQFQHEQRIISRGGIQAQPTQHEHPWARGKQHASLTTTRKQCCKWEQSFLVFS